MTLETYENKRSEVEDVANQIQQDIQDRNLAPDEIIAILLGSYKRRQQQGNELFDQLESRDVDAYRVWTDSPENSETVDDDTIFKQNDKVTISGINRAKGNEAATVYVLGIDEVENKSRMSNTVQRRNEAFVAITRSRAWCHATGTRNGSHVFEEFKSILDQFGTDQNPEI